MLRPVRCIDRAIGRGQTTETLLCPELTSYKAVWNSAESHVKRQLLHVWLCINFCRLCLAPILLQVRTRFFREVRLVVLNTWLSFVFGIAFGDKCFGSHKKSLISAYATWKYSWLRWIVAGLLKTRRRMLIISSWLRFILQSCFGFK